MADDSKGSGLSATDVVLIVIGVLVVAWLFLGVIHVIIGTLWFVLRLVAIVAIVVIAARFLFGRSKSS
ncbi:MAG: hypothetical protein ABSB09_14965 [Acidimicrobiales bacterium]|jgi:hypothetical protein